MKLSLLYLFAIANSKLIRRETEGEDTQVADTAVDQPEEPAAEEIENTEDTEAVEGTDDAGNTNVTGEGDEEENGGDEDLQPENLEGADQTAVDDSAAGDQTDDGTAADDATEGEGADSTSDDTTADDAAQEGEAAPSTGGNGTDASGDTGNAMAMMLSSIFVVLFMIIH